jgi:threonine/homoserine/homoserine lactone efflux protein
VLTFLLLGYAAGALTGVPIGPVNVAVIDAAYRHTLRRALAVGFGGACADGFYAGVGVAWVAPYLRQYPWVSPILYAMSGLVLMVYGFLTARSQPVTPTQTGAPRSPNPSGEIWSGFVVGLALIILNPAAIVTWVVIIAKMIPAATHLEGMVCAGGVFLGSFSWFIFVANLTMKGKNLLGEKAAWIPRGVGIALMFYAVYLLGKAVLYFV